MTTAEAEKEQGKRTGEAIATVDSMLQGAIDLTTEGNSCGASFKKAIKIIEDLVKADFSTLETRFRMDSKTADEVRKILSESYEDGSMLRLINIACKKIDDNGYKITNSITLIPGYRTHKAKNYADNTNIDSIPFNAGFHCTVEKKNPSPSPAASSITG